MIDWQHLELFGTLTWHLFTKSLLDLIQNEGFSLSRQKQNEGKEEEEVGHILFSSLTVSICEISWPSFQCVVTSVSESTLSLVQLLAMLLLYCSGRAPGTQVLAKRILHDLIYGSVVQNSPALLYLFHTIMPNQSILSLIRVTEYSSAWLSSEVLVERPVMPLPEFCTILLLSVLDTVWVGWVQPLCHRIRSHSEPP